MRGRFSLIVVGLAVTAGVAAWTIASAKTTRICKPVVPQINVDLHAAGRDLNDTNLFIAYDEAGAIPFSRESFTNIARYTGCDTNGTRCVASRKRYEFRLEPSRFQSIQIILMNGRGNPIIGGVRWNGPSYPDRVTVNCNLDDQNPSTACKLDQVEYSPSEGYDEKSQKSESIQRFDRCRPVVL
jgi:hypothetical protein